MDQVEVRNNQEKCPSCGGRLEYSPDDKSLKCVFCEKLVAIDYILNNKKHDYQDDKILQKQHDDYVKKAKVFKCSSCGSNIVLNSLEVSGVCPYCASPCVIDESVDIGLKPDYIIPFAFSLEKAGEYYKKGLKKKWFIPNVFKKKPPMDQIRGIYIPAFSFDAKTETTYSGTLEEDYETTDSEGNRHTHTRTFHISGTKRMSHKDIMVETSSHITQDRFMSIEPFNTGACVEYRPQFILGYSVEHYDKSLASCKRLSEDMMEMIIKNAILSGYSYDRVVSYTQDTDFSDEKFCYYILPTYKVDYKYKEKNYTTFMNGQTGKVGSGVPKSPLKITFFVLGIIAIIAAIVLGIYFGTR